jgi:hypothetical protein
MTVMSNTNWTYQGLCYNGPDDIKLTYGFVYKITRISDGKFYVGCKLLWMPKYRMVNKKKKKSMVESNWRKYWSSSESLQADVVELGEDAFTREILHLVKFPGMIKYLETKEIILRECLELSTDKCYNSFLGMKMHRRCVRY